jgi:hypothetical protein
MERGLLKMAVNGSSIAQSRFAAKQREEQNEFERLALEALTTPWWRKFVETMRERRENILEELAAGTHPRREEYILRGQAKELAMMINLDTVARNIKEQRDGEREQAQR